MPRHEGRDLRLLVPASPDRTATMRGADPIIQLPIVPRIAAPFTIFRRTSWLARVLEPTVYAA